MTQTRSVLPARYTRGHSNHTSAGILCLFVHGNNPESFLKYNVKHVNMFSLNFLTCFFKGRFFFLAFFRYLNSLRGHVGPVYQVAWSADSRLLVSGSSDSTLKVWDIKKGKLNADLPGHADEVRY